MANDKAVSQPPKATPEDPTRMGLFMISQVEMNLILRLRQLPMGVHLAILQLDRRGLLGVTVLDGGKFERLRPSAEQV